MLAEGCLEVTRERHLYLYLVCQESSFREVGPRPAERGNKWCIRKSSSHSRRPLHTSGKWRGQPCVGESKASLIICDRTDSLHQCHGT